MAKKKVVIEEVAVEEVVVERACTNCDGSGQACSVCHAGDIVE